MEFKIGSLYKFAAEEDKFDLSNGDLVQVIGITYSGVRFVKHKDHNGSPFCWGTNLFEKDFIEYREDFSFLPHDYRDEFRRRLPREKWLKEHGFEQMSGSTFRLRIVIPIYVKNSDEMPNVDHWIGMDTAEFMSFEELEAYYNELWIKTGREVVETLKKGKAK